MIDRYRAAAGGDPEVEAYIKDTVMKDFDKNIGKRGNFSTFTGQLDKLAEISSLAASDPENARRHYKSLASKSAESSTTSELGEGERYAKDANGTRFVVGADGTTRKAKNQ